MLLEVIKPWPYLLPVSACLRGTPIRLSKQAYTVDTLFVSIEVIYSGKTLTNTLATTLRTHMGLLVP